MALALLVIGSGAGCAGVPAETAAENPTSVTAAEANPPAGSSAAATSTTSTTIVPFDPIRLAVAGDIGTGTEEEWATGVAMDLMEGGDDYRALLLLGDNVYPDGDPELIEEIVMRPFEGVLDGSTELLAALGNHDIIDGNGPEHAERIGMPSEWYATDLGAVLIVTLDSNQVSNPEQLRWLEETLSESDAPWKIATMHHPPYSAGWHGSEEDVQEAFVPLFEAHGVQLVLAGHDHDYQRSKPIEGITYVVSGGGAQLRDAGFQDFTEVSLSVLHFVDLTVRPDRIDLLAIDQNGSVIDSVAIPRVR